MWAFVERVMTQSPGISGEDCEELLDNIEVKLHQGLENASSSETRYQIRSALQKIEINRMSEQKPEIEIR